MFGVIKVCYYICVTINNKFKIKHEETCKNLLSV